jgi:exonuclease VII small subunit
MSAATVLFEGNERILEIERGSSRLQCGELDLEEAIANYGSCVDFSSGLPTKLEFIRGHIFRVSAR